MEEYGRWEYQQLRSYSSDGGQTIPEDHYRTTFHEDSYGYRPSKSAIDAVGVARQLCWRYGWVVDLDITFFFDNIDHELMMKAVAKNTDCRWILLYVERWLKCPVQYPDGEIKSSDKGTPRGGVVSPLLANLFLHYAFDKWMDREFPPLPFERYADDVVCHCRSESQAKTFRVAIEQRLRECRLELHPERRKLSIVRKTTDEGVIRSANLISWAILLGHGFQ
ncbi:hypothetical protein LA52FAK_17830 [Desulforhopalus sp. 52FAK]